MCEETSLWGLIIYHMEGMLCNFHSIARKCVGLWLIILEERHSMVFKFWFESAIPKRNDNTTSEIDYSSYIAGSPQRGSHRPIYRMWPHEWIQAIYEMKSQSHFYCRHLSCDQPRLSLVRWRLNLEAHASYTHAFCTQNRRPALDLCVMHFSGR